MIDIHSWSYALVVVIAFCALLLVGFCVRDFHRAGMRRIRRARLREHARMHAQPRRTYQTSVVPEGQSLDLRDGDLWINRLTGVTRVRVGETWEEL